MDNDFSRYDLFEHRMKEKYPEMFSQPFGGFAVGEGWWPIIESLCSQIQHHINHVKDVRKSLLEDNPYNHKIPDDVDQVVVMQIKEKFGGLRFYYEGGDDMVDGMVRMAESWASHSCEDCGDRGVSRSGGWIRVQCDKHYEEHQRKIAEQRKKETA